MKEINGEVTYVNRNTKDRLFRFIFSKDLEALLDLYNGLHGTNYNSTKDLEIVTLEDVIYLSMKNDLAFMITGVLNLYEHQSTKTTNIPVRMLVYLGMEYQKILAMNEENVYGTKLIQLPTPQCVVFYNGRSKMDEEQILYLSDAYENKEVEPDLELKVRVLNIHYGHNRELMEKCHRLWEYSYFVKLLNDKLDEDMPFYRAVDETIVACIDDNVLADILRVHRMEVLGMLLTEYDEKKVMAALRKEALEDGREEGRKEGRQEGRQEGREEGREEGLLLSLISLIRKKLQKNMSLQDTIEVLESDAIITEALYQLIASNQNAGDGAILKMYQEREGRL